MGDRGQVSVKGADVFFYDHWNCSRLAETVRAALVRAAGRLDSEYLARIVFCEMVRGEELETTGYGIAAAPFGDTWRTVEITPPGVDQAHPAGRVRVTSSASARIAAGVSGTPHAHRIDVVGLLEPHPGQRLSTWTAIHSANASRATTDTFTPRARLRLQGRELFGRKPGREEFLSVPRHCM